MIEAEEDHHFKGCAPAEPEPWPYPRPRRRGRGRCRLVCIDVSSSVAFVMSSSALSDSGTWNPLESTAPRRRARSIPDDPRIGTRSAFDSTMPNTHEQLESCKQNTSASSRSLPSQYAVLGAVGSAADLVQRRTKALDRVATLPIRRMATAQRCVLPAPRSPSSWSTISACDSLEPSHLVRAFRHARPGVRCSDSVDDRETIPFEMAPAWRPLDPHAAAGAELRLDDGVPGFAFSIATSGRSPDVGESPRRMPPRHQPRLLQTWPTPSVASVTISSGPDLSVMSQWRQRLGLSR